MSTSSANEKYNTLIKDILFVFLFQVPIWIVTFMNVFQIGNTYYKSTSTVVTFAIIYITISAITLLMGAYRISRILAISSILSGILSLIALYFNPVIA